MIIEYVLLAGASLISLYVGVMVVAAVGSFICGRVLKCIAREAEDGNA